MHHGSIVDLVRLVQQRRDKPPKANFLLTDSYGISREISTIWHVTNPAIDEFPSTRIRRNTFFIEKSSNWWNPARPPGGYQLLWAIRATFGMHQRHFELAKMYS